jgi:hypothetical protein
MVRNRELAHEPGAAIIHNPVTSPAVPEIITEHGGVPVRTRVGHSFIKAKMVAPMSKSNPLPPRQVHPSALTSWSGRPTRLPSVEGSSPNGSRPAAL